MWTVWTPLSDWFDEIQGVEVGVKRVKRRGATGYAAVL